MTTTEKRDRNVIGVEVDAGAVALKLARRVRIEHVGVPQREIAPSPVETARFFAQAENCVFHAAFAPHHPFAVDGRVGPEIAVFILKRLENRAAIGAVGFEAKRSFANGERELRGCEAHFIFVFGEAKRGRIGFQSGADGESGRFVELSAATDFETHDVVSNHINAQQFAFNIG